MRFGNAHVGIHLDRSATLGVPTLEKRLSYQMVQLLGACQGTQSPNFAAPFTLHVPGAAHIVRLAWAPKRFGVLGLLEQHHHLLHAHVTYAVRDGESHLVVALLESAGLEHVVERVPARALEVVGLLPVS